MMMRTAAAVATGRGGSADGGRRSGVGEMRRTERRGAERWQSLSIVVIGHRPLGRNAAGYVIGIAAAAATDSAAASAAAGNERRLIDGFRVKIVADVKIRHDGAGRRHGGGESAAAGTSAVTRRLLDRVIVAGSVERGRIRGAILRLLGSRCHEWRHGTRLLIVQLSSAHRSVRMVMRGKVHRSKQLWRTVHNRRIHDVELSVDVLLNHGGHGVLRRGRHDVEIHRRLKTRGGNDSV